MYETASAETCPACNGAKVQMNKDGIKVLCPVCGGKGYISKQRNWWEPPHETVSMDIEYKSTTGIS